MGGEMIAKYEQRLEECYDLDNDPVYNTWKKLKQQRQPLGDITNSSKAPQNIPAPHKLNPILEDILKLPQPREARKVTRGTSKLPKHLSSREMIILMEEKRANKEKEEEDTVRRKIERETKKKKREEEKQQKAVLRQQKKEQQQTNGKQKKKQRKKANEVVICPECNEVYEDEGEIRIECSGCGKWVHFDCTDLESDIDLEEIDYVCRACI